MSDNALVAILATLLWKLGFLTITTSPFNWRTVIGVALVTVGLLVFTFKPGFKVRRGEQLAIYAMIGYAFFLVVISESGRRGLETIPVVAGAAFVIALVMGLLSGLLERGNGKPTFNPRIVMAIIWMGVVPGALALLALHQVKADETRRALILSFEPVFAALTGLIALRETFTKLQVAGACTILVGAVIKYLM